MKSPLYILTALLPIAAIALPNPDTGGDGGDELDAPLEERGFEERDLEERDRCRFRKSGSYWKYPCFSSERIGSFRSGDRGLVQDQQRMGDQGFQAKQLQRKRQMLKWMSANLAKAELRLWSILLSSFPIINSS
ncbi:hypothetical protein MW887_003193 [Aspergillus wentii]|nr:hypothetical protein MW887_003193 [Aspergillus wentii]